MQIDIIATLGIVGSVASLIALLLPASGWRAKAIHVSYGLVVTVLAVAIIGYRARIDELSRIEREATRLIATADLSSDGTQRGFILAGLAFLEKYKDRFPDTFDRAKMLSDNVGVTTSKQEDAVERLHQSWRLSDGATAMKQLLGGIAGGGIH